jgi:sigma-B regulation protein RsbU (phosphoserine phosphatase)
MGRFWHVSAAPANSSAKMSAMPSGFHRRQALTGLACLFLGAVGLYSALWIRATHTEPSAFLGVLDFDYGDPEGGVRILGVLPGSPADRAGLVKGDRLLGIDGQAASIDTLAALVLRGRPGATVRLAVRRPSKVTAEPVLIVLGEPRDPGGLSRRLIYQVVGLYPALFLIFSVAVLLLRPDDRHAWLLALLFASFIGSAPYFELQTPPSLRGFALAYKILFNGISSGLFLYFFSVFPAPSPLDRRVPWLKNVWLGAGLIGSLPIALLALLDGTVSPVRGFVEGLSPAARSPLFVYGFGGFLLGFGSLVANAVKGGRTTRRKSRVILAGTLVGFGPAFLLILVATALGRMPFEFPFYVWAISVISMSLMQLSFAYAVVKHQVLEIPVLLRRGARYLLVQRGFLILLTLLGLGATLLFARSFGGSVGPEMRSTGILLGAGFGTLLVVTGTRVQRHVRERVDRAFFRGAYDARQILQDLAEKARAANSREDLGALLDQQVQNALHPSSLAIYLQSAEDVLILVRGSMPPDWASLSPTLPLLSELLRRPGPRDVDESVAFAPLLSLGVESLVPIVARDGHLSGILALGERLSEEAYSGEDKRLLASVASQAGIALDSIHLAEQMVRRLEAERSALQEMDLAKQVQARLLAQEPPILDTACCAGRCIQARAVGGDYYDFIDLGSRRVALALADISGKGFPAALLMASLQASLRSRLAADRLDLPEQLTSVNRLLHRSSEANRFATLFLGIYDDTARTLRYVNCGHNPPILLRADGRVERLPPTATALGLFEDWGCETAEVRLQSGDLLAIFSDGVSEAWSDEGEEFGEERVVEALRASRDMPVGDLVDNVLDVVTRFSGSEQEDDQTLVIARVH